MTTPTRLCWEVCWCGLMGLLYLHVSLPAFIAAMLAVLACDTFCYKQVLDWYIPDDIHPTEGLQRMVVWRKSKLRSIGMCSGGGFVMLAVWLIGRGVRT